MLQGFSIALVDDEDIKYIRIGILHFAVGDGLFLIR
jgi:hypothetical protein